MNKPKLIFSMKDFGFIGFKSFEPHIYLERKVYVYFFNTKESENNYPITILQFPNGLEYISGDHNKYNKMESVQVCNELIGDFINTNKYSRIQIFPKTKKLINEEIKRLSLKMKLMK